MSEGIVRAHLIIEYVPYRVPPEYNEAEGEGLLILTESGNDYSFGGLKRVFLPPKEEEKKGVVAVIVSKTSGFSISDNYGTITFRHYHGIFKISRQQENPSVD